MKILTTINVRFQWIGWLSGLLPLQTWPSHNPGQHLRWDDEDVPDSAYMPFLTVHHHHHRYHHHDIIMMIKFTKVDLPNIFLGLGLWPTPATSQEADRYSFPLYHYQHQHQHQHHDHHDHDDDQVRIESRKLEWTTSARTSTVRVGGHHAGGGDKKVGL